MFLGNSEREDPAANDTSASPVIILKDAAEGTDLYTYELIGLTASDLVDARIFFQSASGTQPPQNSLQGAIYTPSTEMLYNYKLSITNHTHNSLSMTAKTKPDHANLTSKP